MRVGVQQRAMVGLLLAAALVMSGCGYMRDRGRDARHMFDIGITVNKTAKPQFGLFIEQFSILGLGYSNVDSNFYGMANGMFGGRDYTNQSWNALVYGARRDGAEPFDPTDPRQARPDQRDLSERPEFDTGLGRVFTTDNPPPTRQYFECRRIIHAGWVGVVFNIRLPDILNFVVGWTTIDLLGDRDRPMVTDIDQAV